MKANGDQARIVAGRQCHGYDDFGARVGKPKGGKEKIIYSPYARLAEDSFFYER